MIRQIIPIHRVIFPFVVAIAFLASFDASTEEPGGALEIAPGVGGAVSTWLVLGPVKAPPGVGRSEEGLAGWDPLGPVKGDEISDGARSSGDSWSLSAARTTRTRLDRTRPGLAYMAAILRSDRPREIHLSFGCSGGMEATLGGKRILRREEGRRAEPDTDLVPVNLDRGDNLLLVRTWKGSRGDWSLFFRIMDEQFRRPRGVFVVLPGAGRSEEEAIRRTASLRTERELLPDEAAMRVRYWVEFAGGMPLAGNVSAELEILGPEGSAPRPVVLDMADGRLPFDLIGEGIYSGERCPNSARLRIGKGVMESPVGLRMRDVKAVAEAAGLMAASEVGQGLPTTSVESVRWRIRHLTELLEAGDRDYRYLGAESKETLALAKKIAMGEDPYRDARGAVQRRGYRSSLDGRYHPYALYVPPGWREKGDHEYGLLVSLHGLNSSPMKAMTAVMGVPLADGESKESRERHPPGVGNAPMFVVAPEGFGNSGYAAFGERDVEEVIALVRERYRIDPDRIYMTGASMGGIGAASIPLHRPDVFAAAAPLCGYHSLFEYRSLAGADLLPWERRLASFRSNAQWADHGRHLPLYVVHGTRDGIRHSKSLVEAFRLRKFDVTFETPDAGHNVWDRTYADKAIFDHFKKYRRRVGPRRVTVNTSRLRYNANRWLRIDDTPDHGGWARVDGDWGEDGEVVLTTSNVAAFTVVKEAGPKGGGEPKFVIDGTALAAGVDDEGEWRFVGGDGGWRTGAPDPCEHLCKRPGLAGPIDDVYYEPLLFVYGTANPDETALARRLIGRIKYPRRGVSIEWPVKADVEVSREDIETRSLVVVGTFDGNSLLARMARKLPIRVEDGAVIAGAKRYEGQDVAASFVYPNPLNPDRYVLVHTGVTPRAFFRAGHLPQLLPDWLVYDGSNWERSGGLVMKERAILDGGMFDNEWRLKEHYRRPTPGPAQKP